MLGYKKDYYYICETNYPFYTMEKPESQILTLRDNAKAGLLEIKTIEAGISHINKLKALETWVKAEKKDAELQNMIAEQKLRTQRILGELLQAGKDTGELAKKGSFNGNQYEGSNGIGQPKTIDELGLTRNQSSNFQKIASIPEDDFENFIQSKKEAVNNAVAELTTMGALRLASGLTHTYQANNRLTGYFNTKNARIIRAYAYNKNMDASDVIVLMCQDFINRMSDEEKSKILETYLRDIRIGDIKIKTS